MHLRKRGKSFNNDLRCQYILYIYSNCLHLSYENEASHIIKISDANKSYIFIQICTNALWKSTPLGTTVFFNRRSKLQITDLLILNKAIYKLSADIKYITKVSDIVAIKW